MDEMPERIIELLELLQSDTKETRDRARRVETRITRFLEFQGFDTKTKRVEWDDVNKCVQIPSRDVSLSEAIEVIPQDKHDMVAIYIKSNLFARVKRPN